MKKFIIIIILLIFSTGVQGQEGKSWIYYEKTIDSHIDTTIAISGMKTEWIEGRTLKGYKKQVIFEYKNIRQIILCHFKYFRTESAEIAYDDSIFACPVCHKFAEHKMLLPKESYFRSYWNYWRRMSSNPYNETTTCPFCNNIYRGRWIKKTEKEKK